MPVDSGLFDLVDRILITAIYALLVVALFLGAYGDDPPSS